jgi:phospholipid transport system transporter-binding protein
MLTRDGDRLRIDGHITVDNVRALLEQGGAQLADVHVIDLAAVSDVDSSAVSLILEWQREAAQHNNHDLRFENLPANLRSLASLYGVAELIRQ